jgi:phosphatidylglycerophosphatase A
MALSKGSNILAKLKTKSKISPPIPEAVWRKPLYFIAFGLGSGAIPFAPGTFGTLMAIPFYLLIEPFSVPIYLLFVILFIAASIWICDRLIDEIHVEDHPGMCIDEFAGFFVTLINAPHGWQWVTLGFILFRIFDIWKPWPIYIIDKKIHGGFGMVLDDVVAGLYSLIIIQLIKVIVIM